MWISNALIAVLRLLIGVTARWEGPPDLTRQRIYFANHSSHMDTLAIMAALPPEARVNVKPVAAADYWGKNRFLSYISQQGLNAVLIERNPAPGTNVLEPIFDVVRAGHSIIIFPEGTRSSQALPGPFKSGIYRLSETFPDVDLVPIYLENLHRSMPKGKHVPLPIICTIRIGNPLPRIAGEDKQLFLERARDAIVRLSK
ncbi:MULTISPECIES: lysophospholipid acyltransferase family protein [unclassified Pseudomonas]|jgi:1-acyl-sn-glycerol-3-phosphate acyltransferase|uniref:lysophospholipid acyltransferase family protein n=1 Tax=unclassified Pseudomonas TaxID=196821 RepID=UPI000703742F|nr:MULTISPECIES: lysophospholipid acyltransferase family protein [unclassified Pseudomonas]KQZ78964.1 acyltransferase [Pseudomonas sp. Root562]